MKFKEGDIVIPLECATDMYSFTCQDNKWIGKVISVLPWEFVAKTIYSRIEDHDKFPLDYKYFITINEAMKEGLLYEE